MKEELQITAERIDDFVVLLALMQQMDLPAILDRQLPRHWLQQGVSWGWTATIWLAHIVSQGDHRKLTVRDWVRQAHSTLEQVTGLDIRETDFTDDRLTIVLRHLAQEQRWQGIEQELGEHLVRVYALEEQPIRVDATTVSGYREGGADSLWQFGHSKDDPTLRQIKAMMATLDPLALPLALVVVSGERADDPLYVPIIDRVLGCLGRTGLLFVGDSKMSALATRADLVAHEQYYMTALAQVGETAELMLMWFEAGVKRGRGSQAPTAGHRAGALSDHRHRAPGGSDCHTRLDVRLARLCQQCASEASVAGTSGTGISPRVPHRTGLRTAERRTALDCAALCQTRRSGGRHDASAESGLTGADSHGVCGASFVEAAGDHPGGTLQG